MVPEPDFVVAEVGVTEIVELVDAENVMLEVPDVVAVGLPEKVAVEQSDNELVPVVHAVCEFVFEFVA